MSATSEYGYAIDMPAGPSNGHTLSNLIADEPMGANRATYLANNAQHLSDECTQYRVNWVEWLGSEGWVTTVSGKTDYTHIMTHFFPVTVNHEGHVPDFYVRIGAYTTTSTFHVAAMLEPIGGPLSYARDLADNVAELDATTVATAGDAGWIIESVASGDYDNSTFGKTTAMKTVLPAFTEYDGTTRTTIAYGARLSIYGKHTFATATGTICGVSVREFHYEAL